MDAHQIHAKLYLAAGSDLSAADLVPVFHGWIQRQALPGELLIDVADYSHVHDGPSAVLIAHESHYALDRGGGRPGLLYARKRETQAVPPGQRFAAALRRLFYAARLLSDEKHIEFDTRELLLRVADRLRAPNTDATWAALEPMITPAVQALYGSAVRLDREGSEREPLSVRIRAQEAASLNELWARLDKVS